MAAASVRDNAWQLEELRGLRDKALLFAERFEALVREQMAASPTSRSPRTSAAQAS